MQPEAKSQMPSSDSTRSGRRRSGGRRRSRVLEQLDQEQAVLDADRAEAEVLVVAADALAVQVDVEELPGPQRLRHRVQEAEPRHRLVGDLGVHADHLRVAEPLDERERVAHRRQEDVAARLVRLRLDPEAHVVAAVDHVLAAEVDGLAIALEARHAPAWPHPPRPPRGRPRTRRSERRARRPGRCRGRSSGGRSDERRDRSR